MVIEKPVKRIYPMLYFIGIIITVLGCLQLVPLLVSLIYKERFISSIFLGTASFTILVGEGLMAIGYRYRSTKLSFGEGTVVAAGAWLLGTMLCALPYYFSGSCLSFIDSCFDVMSGLTTTGLCLIQDMDHLSNGINMWRQTLTFTGGQGMVVLALTFLTKDQSNAYKMYVGEGKDEKLFPNAVSTARQIWKISIFYLIIGTVVMTFAARSAGLAWDRAFLHGMWVYMSAWSTGGFAPMSQNILYYHSSLFEIGAVVFFVIGSLNFALHHAVLSGRVSEIRKNIETITFTISFIILSSLVTVGLMKNNVYPDLLAFLRKGLFHLISGQTTTGFMTVYAKQFYYEWGDIALVAMTIAMLLGGSACSTAGGFKALRIGVIFETFKTEVKKLLLPESRIVEYRIHHIKEMILSDSLIRSSFLIVTAYLVTFTVGTLITLLFGYPLTMAAFESASVTGNVGLSIGVTSTSMPLLLKITYIIMMWLGRLEFMSIFALFAFVLKGGLKK